MGEGAGAYYEIGYLNNVNKINDVTKLSYIGDDDASITSGRAYIEHSDDVDYKVGDLINII